MCPRGNSPKFMHRRVDVRATETETTHTQSRADMHFFIGYIVNRNNINRGSPAAFPLISPHLHTSTPQFFLSFPQLSSSIRYNFHNTLSQNASLISTFYPRQTDPPVRHLRMDRQRNSHQPQDHFPSSKGCLACRINPDGDMVRYTVASQPLIKKPLLKMARKKIVFADDNSSIHSYIFYRSTKDIEDKDSRGMIVLGYLSGKKGDTNEHLDLKHPLASGFKLTKGRQNIVIPNVVQRETYIIVLFGDSGNASPMFTITNSNPPNPPKNGRSRR